MAEDAAILRMKKDKAEKDYDAAVTALNRCQAQLSSKAAQSQKLPMDEYRKWLADKKQEQTTLMAELQVLKKRRAEARRQFNCWKPEVKEEWLEWPDEEGWWWNHTANRAEENEITIHRFVFDEGDDAYLMSANALGEEDDHNYDSCWKYQEEPETP